MAPSLRLVPADAFVAMLPDRLLFFALLAVLLALLDTLSPSLSVDAFPLPGGAFLDDCTEEVAFEIVFAAATFCALRIKVSFMRVDFRVALA
eukprot:CAMPEP_0171530822 /NCGR_PEP_ID=MMETSP0959-20130129/13402_1 /TAXON_ID=87120 /ORGANISM="Aurantiochytrium limacinum, Strain ATCCMYA-1381" /LENGTH=91 /DNA_ID=CAMNT_0012073879 /DNA_START=483 /DNA_END=756 /DNA_ORIENTATION=-